MKYTSRQLIEGPIELVEAVGLDRSRDVKVYPNVTSCKMLKEERKGSKRYVKVETVANGDIPPKLRKLVSPKMLTWIEYGEYDFDTKVYKYRVKPFYFSNIVKVSGVIKYIKKGEDKTLRTLDAEVRINLPVLGAIAERKIAEIQKANLELDIKNMREEVKELLKKQKK